MKTCDYCGKALTRGETERAYTFRRRTHCDQRCHSLHVSANWITEADLFAYVRSPEGRAFIAECRRPRFRRAA